MTKVAVILSGCGYLDGSEISEVVLTLLYLSQQGAEVGIFAPDIDQSEVVNHVTGKIEEDQKRNVFTEAARIARGNIRKLGELNPDEFDALIMPGGYGAAKNLSNFAWKGKDAEVIDDVKSVIKDFISGKKPVGVICISPAILVAAISEGRVTIGDDDSTVAAIEAMGGEHIKHQVTDIEIDSDRGIVSCPAYMFDAPLCDVATGIEKLVRQVIALVE